MKEARLIVPAGVSDIARGQIEVLLVNEFGGFTKFQGVGAWMHVGILHNEIVTIYDIAAPQTKVAEMFLHAAAQLVLDGGETAVYLRHTDGEVVILEA